MTKMATTPLPHLHQAAAVAVLLLQLLVARASAQRLYPVARPGCRDMCGNVTIPYPFGIGAGCYRDVSFGFRLKCDDSRSPPRLTVDGFSSKLTALSLYTGEARAHFNVTRECYNSTGGLVDRNSAPKSIL